MTDFRQNAVHALVRISGELANRGWLRATSGNLSVRDPETGVIFITRSGADKQRLTAHDVLTLAPDGRILEGEGKPSFETAIHQTVYQHTSSGAVLHVHTVYNNLVSRHAGPEGLALQDHEMLKALGHWQEGARITVPVVENYADIHRLAQIVSTAIDPTVPAVLLKRHGIYAFGESPDAALRHLEALEFLFEWLCLDRLTESIGVLPV